MPSRADVDSLVRGADPAQAATPEDELDALVRQAALIAATTPARRPRRRPRRALAAVPMLAALLVAIPVALDSGGTDGLAADAYAATDPGDRIVHEVAVTTFPAGHGPPGGRETRETWWRGSDGAARSVTTNAAASRTVVVEPQERAAPGIRGVTFEFRDRFQAAKLHDEGMTTLGGRAVHAYSYRGWLTFFIDPGTMALAGSRQAYADTPGSGFVTTVIKTYEMLPPTPGNLAKLG